MNEKNKKKKNENYCLATNKAENLSCIICSSPLHHYSIYGGGGLSTGPFGSSLTGGSFIARVPGEYTHYLSYNHFNYVIKAIEVRSPNPKIQDKSKTPTKKLSDYLPNIYCKNNNLNIKTLKCEENAFDYPLNNSKISKKRNKDDLFKFFNIFGHKTVLDLPKGGIRELKSECKKKIKIPFDWTYARSYPFESANYTKLAIFSIGLFWESLFKDRISKLSDNNFIHEHCLLEYFPLRITEASRYITSNKGNKKALEGKLEFPWKDFCEKFNKSDYCDSYIGELKEYVPRTSIVFQYIALPALAGLKDF